MGKARSRRPRRPVQSDGRVHGVAVAVMREDGRYLVIRRSKHVGSPRKVCFPGGTVELGETQEAAVVREMWEELRAEVTPVKPVWRHDFSDKPWQVFGWVAWMELPDIDAPQQAIEEVFWVQPQEAGQHADALTTGKSFVDEVWVGCAGNGEAPGGDVCISAR